jgi:hypothetical protein
VRVDRLDDDVDDAPCDDLDEGGAGPDVPADLEFPEAVPDAPADGLRDSAAPFAEYREKVDAAYRSHAIDQGCERVREIEETVVTPAMLRIESEDPTRHLVGLDHCLKGKDRLTEKVSRQVDAQPSLTYENAFASVKDAIRYTFQYPDERYADGVRTDCERLESASFELVELRNTWDNDEYKGINSRWKIPETGQLFEVQFHTEDSFEAKQRSHGAYEKLRHPDTPPAERDAMRSFQREVTARVPAPVGAADIPDYP